ncbi:aminotransferase class I/II-fold pyridoxal phosphate-dependent enzyme, partial [Acinetobacter baumannii]
ALPATWLEDAVPAAAVQRGLARAHLGMASRCPPQGLPELRERIAAMLRGQGMAVDASRVLTTYGGTQAIDLICRALLRPGDAVAV